MLNQIFNELKLEQHPDKTIIGRTVRGFDFLGYHFKPDELTVADKTIERFVERIARLYEQGADSVRIGQYVRRWHGWASGYVRTTSVDTVRVPGATKAPPCATRWSLPLPLFISLRLTSLLSQRPCDISLLEAVQHHIDAARGAQRIRVRPVGFFTGAPWHVHAIEGIHVS